MQVLDVTKIHPTWKEIVQEALNKVDPDYLNQLAHTDHWLPGKHQIFNAFTVPRTHVKHVLMGESPYPRVQSANGFAFWDAHVGTIWSSTGFSKTLNRATSLRHFVKMLLVAQQLLSLDDISQAAIAKIDKKPLVDTLDELFTHMLDNGFLLLNASLVYSPNQVRYHANHWSPFMTVILNHLLKRSSTNLLLFGAIARQLNIPQKNQDHILLSEHPYNGSFVHNRTVIQYFRPLQLLLRSRRASS